MHASTSCRNAPGSIYIADCICHCLAHAYVPAPAGSTGAACTAHYELTTPDLPCSASADLISKKSAVVEMPQVSEGEGRRFLLHEVRTWRLYDKELRRGTSLKQLRYTVFTAFIICSWNKVCID
jgi:hypothetical protein